MMVVLKAPLRVAALAILVGLPTIGAAPAWATETVITSRSPYWKVGVRDKALSTACAMGRFNEREPGRYTVRFFGKEGGLVLGIAKGTGFNLRDPDKRAKQNEDYFFRNSTSTDCEVFVGGRLTQRPKGAPAPK